MSAEPKTYRYLVMDEISGVPLVFIEAKGADEAKKAMDSLRFPHNPFAVLTLYVKCGNN